MGGAVGAQPQPGRVQRTPQSGILHAAVVKEDEARLGVQRNDVVEVRSGQPQRPKDEIEVAGPQPLRESRDVLLRALLEAARRRAARKQVDDFGLDRIPALGVQQPCDERSRSRLDGPADPGRRPGADQCDASGAAGLRHTAAGRDRDRENDRHGYSRQSSHDNKDRRSPASGRPVFAMSDRPRLFSELRLLANDLPGESLELIARPKAELVLKSTARSLIDLECFRLTVGAVQRHHELGDEALAVGALLDEPMELAHDLLMASERKIRIDTYLERPGPKLLEALRFCTSTRLQG